MNEAKRVRDRGRTREREREREIQKDAKTIAKIIFTHGFEWHCSYKHDGVVSSIVKNMIELMKSTE